MQWLRCFGLGLALSVALSLWGSWAIAGSPPSTGMPTVAGCIKSISHLRDPKVGATRATSYWELEDGLITRIVERGELNTGWDQHALSPTGAVGLAQILPSTVCHHLRKAHRGACSPTREVLDRIALRLRNEWRYNLCWAGAILADLTWECRGQSMCRAMIYARGDAALAYAKRTEP
jgi:hypothetical protein